MKSLYCVANEIALKEYGVEFWRIEDKARRSLAAPQLKRFRAVLLTRARGTPYVTEVYAANEEEARKKLLWRYRRNHAVVSRVEEVG